MPDRTDTQPEIFGPYLVYERLGVGGMATVHRAKERGIEGFERQVALKRLLPHLAEDEQFVRAFVREAKLASMLTHTNIVQLFELGRVDHVYFISMELIEGRDLRKLLRQARRITGPAPVDVIVALLIEICDALDYAHTRTDSDGEPLGLVHRDVSPSNVIVTKSGHVKIIDFGIAKANTIHMRTATGRVKGKMAYMAPEATRGEKLDARSDIFSAGVIAHELLTARPLFATKNDYQTLMRVQNAPVAPPSTYNQSSSPELDAIVLRALAKDPDERYRSAAEMRDALDSLRQKHGLNATSREVCDWMQWAFALEMPAKAPRTPARVTPPTLSRSGLSRSQLYTPPTGSMDFFADSLPPLEADDEVIEIAWGGREQEGVPVVLDDVPDRSGGILFQDTPEPDLESSGAVVSMNPSAKSGSTLLTYVPPPPTRGRAQTPTPVPSGRAPTSPGTVRARERGRTPIPVVVRGLDTPTTKPATDESESALADFAKRMQEELSGSRPMPKAVGTPAKNEIPKPSKLARSSSPGLVLPELDEEPRPPTPAVGVDRAARGKTNRERARTSRPTTDFGAHIVERERGGWRRGLIAFILVAGIAAAAFVLTGRRKAKSDMAATDIGTLKVVVEPKDATVEIKGETTFDTSPVRVKLPAKSYTVEIRKDGYRPWSSVLTLEKNETQTLRVVLAREGSTEKTTATKTSEPTPAQSKSKNADKSDDERESRSEERKRKRRRERPIDEANIIDETRMVPDESTKTVEQAEPGSVPLSPLSVKGSEPPPRVAERGPVVVLSNQVHKLSGRPPHIHMRRGDKALPKRISVRMCIDRSGKVTTAKVLSDVSSDVRSTVEEALGSWRYAPYRRNGAIRPACFAVSFRTR
jgi:serine/threonine protein kinase